MQFGVKGHGLKTSALTLSGEESSRFLSRGEMASTRWFEWAPRCVGVDSLQIKMYPYMWIHIFLVKCQPFFFKWEILSENLDHSFS